MPPQQGTRYSNIGRRPYIGDAYFETRANIILEDSTQAAMAGRLYENAYQGAVDAHALVGSLWVPTPLDNVNAELSFTPSTVTPNVTSLNEQLVICSRDVSAWLSRGTKFVCVDTSSGSAVVKYAVVTNVNGTQFTLLLPVGTAVLGVIAPASAFFSNAHHPHGFDLDPLSWACRYVSGSSDIGVGNSSAWTTAPGPAGVRVPAGCWQIDFASLIEYGVFPADNVNPGTIAAFVGLAAAVDTAPAGDLTWVDLDNHQGDRPERYAIASASADRTFPYGGTNLLAVTLRNGTQSKMHLRNDVRPTIVRARCSLI